MGEKPIILYSSPECVRCQLVKQMLDEHNVQYIEKELLEVPAIEVGEKTIDSYVGVLAWLQDNDYYSLGKDDKDEGN
jgi:glutaredoxin